MPSFSINTLSQNITWVVGNGVNPTLHKKEREFILQISQGPFCNPDSPQCQGWIAGLKQLVDATPWLALQDTFSSSSLLSLTYRCIFGNDLKVGLNFVHLVNLLLLSLKVDQ